MKKRKIYRKCKKKFFFNNQLHAHFKIKFYHYKKISEKQKFQKLIDVFFIDVEMSNILIINDLKLIKFIVSLLFYNDIFFQS